MNVNLNGVKEVCVVLSRSLTSAQIEEKTVDSMAVKEKEIINGKYLYSIEPCSDGPGNREIHSIISSYRRITDFDISQGAK